MAWLDGWGKRIPISVYNSGSSAPGDVTAVVPASLDDFWATIDVSGNEIRVTAGDGVTAVVYQWEAGFSAASRSGTLSLDDVTLGAASVTIFWLYYDNAGAASAAGSFTPAATKTSTIAQGAPPGGGMILGLRAEAPGVTTPTQRIGKATGAGVYLWWEIEGLIGPLQRTAYDVPRLEEPLYLTWDVQASGSSVPGMLVASSTYLTEYEGRCYLVGYVYSGSSGTDYVGIARVSTTLPGTFPAVHRVLEGRCLIAVYDPVES